MADGTLLHIPTIPDVPHPLGRSVVWHDPRNRQYGIRALLETDVAPVAAQPRYARHVFDQGGSSCTMQADTGALLSSPLRLNVPTLRLATQLLGTEQQRHQAYLESQHLDPWPGGEPTYEGTSSDASLKWMRNRGIIKEWRWGFGVQDLNDTLLRRSVAGIGSIWHESMFYVNKRGFLIVNQNSGVAGGHKYLILGYDQTDDEYYILNSWSRAWGVNGRAKVKGVDMRYLIANDGDVTMVVL